MPRRFWGELKRRNVFRVAAAYAIIAWILVQIADTVFPRLLLPDWTVTLTIVLVLLGFPIALFLAWAYELTPEGVLRAGAADAGGHSRPPEARWPDYVLIGALVVVAGIVIADRAAPPREMAVAVDAVVAPAADVPVPTINSVAVLPFAVLSVGPDDGYFADGLTEEIRNALAQLPELLVIGRTSAYHFKDSGTPLPEIGSMLGVRHLVEGSVQRDAGRLRVTAQLVRADDGTGLWSQRYDRTVEDVFAMQDDIAAHVAEALGVLLDDGRRERMVRAGVRNVDAFIEFEKGRELFDLAHRSGAQRNALLREANMHFDRALVRDPGFYAPYIFRSDLYIHLIEGQIEGVPMAGFTEEEVAAAPAELMASLEGALTSAKTPLERQLAAFTRVFYSDDWQGLAASVELLFSASGCVPILFGGQFVLFDPRGAYEFLKRQTICEPLDGFVAETLAMSAVWAGLPQDAIIHADAAEGVGRRTQLNRWRVWAYLALGEHDAAESTLRQMIEGPSRAILRVMIWAATGNLEGVQAAIADAHALFGSNPKHDLVFYAWTGDRERANANAAALDAIPLSGETLERATVACLCGAPFDLEATPNFARNVEAAGLAWPPPSPIRFPAKDW